MSPTCKPALVAAVGLVFLQQVTGQPSVLYYAVTIFEDIGLDTVATIGVSAFKLVATLIATVSVDKFGRKLLLKIGCYLMAVALLLIAVAFCFEYTSASDCALLDTETTCGDNSQCLWDDATTYCDTSGIDLQRGTILGAMFLYIGGYQVGFGPVSWLIISEIFPLEVRGQAVSIAVCNNFFWNMVMSFSFSVELEVIGAAATFFIFLAVDLYAIRFIETSVPETKGLSLEQIEDMFQKKHDNTRHKSSLGFRR
jgi:MFS family permease